MSRNLISAMNLISTDCLVGQVHRNKDTSITLKLADFGLAMEVKELIFTVCGTPTYVAPEILTESGALSSSPLSLFLFGECVFVGGRLSLKMRRIFPNLPVTRLLNHPPLRLEAIYIQ